MPSRSTRHAPSNCSAEPIAAQCTSRCLASALAQLRRVLGTSRLGSFLLNSTKLRVPHIACYDSRFACTVRAPQCISHLSFPCHGGGEMSIKVGINGFGRIGRNILRTALNEPNLEFVAVNDLTDTKTLAHLLKYDSILGSLSHKVTATGDSIQLDNKRIRVFAQKDPAQLDWESVGAQVVVESTGRFTNAEDARKHLRGTVKKVIISAPAKNE